MSIPGNQPVVTDDPVAELQAVFASLPKEDDKDGHCPSMTGVKKKKRGGGIVQHYGNERYYLARRLNKHRPIKERWASGEISARAAAIEAGVIKVTPPHLRRLEDLCRAWERASLEDRQTFLLLYGEDIMATEEGDYVPPPLLQRKNGPYPYVPAEGAEIGPLEALLQRGETVSGVARRLGVSHRTVCRWRSGATRPGAAMVERLAGLTTTEDEGP